jgi:hypothetical protein
MFPTRPHLRPGLTVALAAILPVRRVTFAGGEARSRTRREPVPSEEVTTDLWKIWTEAACTLDVPDCDWHTLQRVEQLLRLLSSELDRTLAAEYARAPHGAGDRREAAALRRLRRTLAWVRRNEYDALESELQTQLTTALLLALGPLDALEQQRELQSLPEAQDGQWPR